MKITTKLWIGLGILVVLSPLGLLFPELFKAGAAWGEWGMDEIQELVGYVPAGLEKLARLSVAYILSALAGVAVTVIIVLLTGRLLAKKGS